MSKQSSVCKIYYLPIDGGGFKEVPTVEYQQPEEPCWQERLMDVIGWSVVCVVIGVGGSVIFSQIIMWVARWLGWWAS